MITISRKINLAFSVKRLLLGLFCLGLGTGQAVASTLDDVKFSALPGDRFEVRMEFSEQPPTPKGYTIEQPARIVMDFPGVASGLEQNRFPLSMVNGKSALILEGDGRTRLVLNLAELVTYRSRTEGDSTYIIEVGRERARAQVADAEATPPASTAVVSNATPDSSGGAASSGDPQITNIDFRRGDDDEGKVVVKLSDPQVNVDMQESGGAIELKFAGVKVPADLANRYDVMDFATPVKYVDADNEGSGALIRVEATGEYDYLAYQTDQEYIISVKPLTEQEIEERESRFNYTGERISLNFQDIEVRAVLQMLADFTDLNLVTSDSVTGNVALRLDNVPWDQALEVILKSQGLDKRQVGNVLTVAPAAEIAERERQDLETAKQLEELAPLRTEYIRIRYANAQELFNLFGGGSGGGDNVTGSVLSERGHAIVDERTNSIILTDTEDKIAKFRRLVDQVDIPIRQVMIEARIVIANTDFREEMGVRWGGDGYTIEKDGNHSHEFGGNLNVLEDRGPFGHFVPEDPGDPSSVDERDLEDSLLVDLGIANPAGNLTYAFFSDNVFLELELSALEDSGNAEIVSQPKVITGDKQQATIESGTEIPYQEASASGATSTSFQEAVLKLDVTPQITPDDNIIMDLAINQDSVGQLVGEEGAQIPSIDVTQIQTQVLVADGETVVLGGIYQTDQQQGVTKVPLLGDIPYLGRLFRQEITRQNKRELLIFITPKILSETLVK